MYAIRHQSAICSVLPLADQVAVQQLYIFAGQGDHNPAAKGSNWDVGGGRLHAASHGTHAAGQSRDGLCAVVRANALCPDRSPEFEPGQTGPRNTRYAAATWLRLINQTGNWPIPPGQFSGFAQNRPTPRRSCQTSPHHPRADQTGSFATCHSPHGCSPP